MPSTELARADLRVSTWRVALGHILGRLWAARWCWCLVLLVAVAANHFAGGDGHPFAAEFTTPDDAVRLIQVREFLAHGNWFDTLLPSIGAPEGLQSHWSRLIDAPIAFLIAAFGLVSGPNAAEAAAQIVWPLLVLLVLARVLVAEACHRAGPLAGLILLALVLVSPIAASAFRPGRIDHHNVQIACAVIATYLLARALVAPRAGWLAGGVMALGLAVGLEALPLVAVILAGACFISCFDKAARPGTVNALAALFLGLAAGFAVSVAPAAWLPSEWGPAGLSNVVCDALSLNLLALAACGAAAGVLLRRFALAAPPLVWIAGYAIAAIGGVSLYVGANPACAGGAFSEIDPLVRELWLDTVTESMSLLSLSEKIPALALSYVAFVAIAAAAAVHKAWHSRSSADMLIAGAAVLAALYGFYYVKFMSYGVWMALVPLAVAIASLPAVAGVSAGTVRFGAFVAANQTTLLALSGALLVNPAVGSDAAAEPFAAPEAACLQKSDIARLRVLPPGLVVSNLNISPFIALATPHRVAAGPYHRIHPAIRRQLQALLAPVDEAERRLRDIGADYVVLCLETTKDADAPAAAPNFTDHLSRGGAPDFLERVDIGPTLGPLAVWKLRPAQ